MIDGTSDRSITIAATGETFTYTPDAGDIVTCEAYSSLECATPIPAVSDPLPMKINPKGTPTIIIRRKN